MSARLELAPRPAARGPEPLLAFVADAGMKEAVRRVLEQRKLTPALLLDGGIAVALRRADPEILPRVLLVDVSGSAAPAADVAALAAVCPPGTRIIALGLVNDVPLFRDLMAAGAADYLVAPLKPAALQAAILEAERAGEPAPAEARQGRTAVIFGARGGVGATTLAVNAAWLLAHELDRKVALVDLDLHFGTIALALDIDPGRGLRDALERPSRIDSLFIERAMVRESERLHVLGCEEPLQEEPALDPGAPGVLLHELRQKFEWVVVDLPRGAGILQCQVLTAASHVTLVCQMSLPGMRDAIRLKSLVETLAPQAKLLMVAGIAKDGTGGRLSRAAFERGLGRALDHVIPLDAKAAAAATDSGKPLAVLARQSPTVKAFRKLAEDMAAPDGRRKPVAFWRRWMS